MVSSRMMLLGRSEDGRPIVVVRAGNPRGTRVLVVGCIHGVECAGIAVARALERARTRADLWIVADLNPDGHAAGARQDGRGVDLSANWSSQWHGRGRPWDVYYPRSVAADDDSGALAQGRGRCRLPIGKWRPRGA
jgi:murein tripeptide amidase MpaA